MANVTILSTANKIVLNDIKLQDTLTKEYENNIEGFEDFFSAQESGTVGTEKVAIKVKPIEKETKEEIIEFTEEYAKNGKFLIEKEIEFTAGENKILSKAKGLFKGNITVNIPAYQPVLRTLNISENNKVFTPPVGVDGYNQVVVNIPQEDQPNIQELKEVKITSNGIKSITPDSGYDAIKSLNIEVQVPEVIKTELYDIVNEIESFFEQEIGGILTLRVRYTSRVIDMGLATHVILLKNGEHYDEQTISGNGFVDFRYSAAYAGVYECGLRLSSTVQDMVTSSIFPTKIEVEADYTPDEM